MTDISMDTEYQKYMVNQSGAKINLVNQYDLVRDAYHGTGGFRNGLYLASYPNEMDFSQRVGYSFYLNYFRPIIDALVNPIFGNGPERISEDEDYNIFQKNCNLKGDSLTRFMRRCATLSKRDGVVFIVMDNFSDIPSNAGDARKARKLPYIYVKKAQDCVYYKTDKFGKLIEIAFKEHSGDSTKNGEENTVYRKWTAKEWGVYAKFDAGKEIFEELLKGGANSIGELPVIPLLSGDPEEDPVLPTPPLYDIARINVAIFNIWSEAREIMRKAGFPTLAIPMDSGKKPQDINVGAGNIIGYPMGASQAPEYITPNTDIIKIYTDSANMLKEEIYRQAKINGVVGVIQNSGKAKEWDFTATMTELVDFSRVLEECEYRIVDLFGKWTQKTLDVQIEYSEDFGVADHLSDIDRGQKLIDMGMPLEVVKEIKKDLVSAEFSKRTPAERQELMDAIENEVIDEQQSDTDSLNETTDTPDN
jgi:hypothetical protein